MKLIKTDVIIAILIVVLLILAGISVNFIIQNVQQAVESGEVTESIDGAAEWIGERYKKFKEGSE